MRKILEIRKYLKYLNQTNSSKKRRTTNNVFYQVTSGFGFLPRVGSRSGFSWGSYPVSLYSGICRGIFCMPIFQLLCIIKYTNIPALRMQNKNPFLPILFSSSERVDRNSIVVRLYNRGVPSTLKGFPFPKLLQNVQEVLSACLEWVYHGSYFIWQTQYMLRTCEGKGALKWANLLLLSNKCFKQIELHVWPHMFGIFLIEWKL